MSFYLLFAVNSVLLGFGLAMDAFSVSLANGFAEPLMKKKRMLYISGIYAAFQFAMPVIGWFLVHFAVVFFKGFRRFTPFIALILLAYIGGKLLLEGIKSRKCNGGGQCENCPENNCDIRGEISAKELTTGLLMIQGIATSIDALSVGFAIEEYSIPQVFGSAAIIGIVTYIICFFGLILGTKFGTKLAGNAKIVGGIILIGIGLEIFIKGMIG
jgi:putative Mn2+ efflux pump MntP